MLIEQPISTPGIFSIAGIDPGDTAVIERSEREARVRDGVQVAANHWESAGWYGHARGENSPERSRLMSELKPQFDTAFAWLQPPIRNDNTRLAMVADAREGRMIARGYETTGAVTDTLDLTWGCHRLTPLAPSRKAKLQAAVRRLAPRLPERWQSGRSRRTRNAEYSQGYRGFEIPPSPPV